MITGLAGVIIYTTAKRYSEMRSFYVDLLCLDPRSDRDGFVNFELGNQRLTVTVHSDLAGPNTDPLHMMINLATSEIHSDYAAAVDAGAQSMRPPEQEFMVALWPLSSIQMATSSSCSSRRSRRD